MIVQDNSQDAAFSDGLRFGFLLGVLIGIIGTFLLVAML